MATVLKQPRCCQPAKALADGSWWIPPLQNGDRLTRDEFERRYHAMPRLKKAELIDGVVYMPSPVVFTDHGGPHFDVIAWLGMYRMSPLNVGGNGNSTVRQ